MFPSSRVVITHPLCRRTVQRDYAELWEHAGDRQHTAYRLRSNALIRKISAWSTFQLLYIPGVAKLKEQTTAADTNGPEGFEIPLWLPSQIREHVKFDLHYAHIEWELRVGQASEAITSLRRELFLHTHLRNFKSGFSRGQTANTRAQNALSTVNRRMAAHAADYRAARSALQSLSITLERGAEMVRFPELGREDIRGLSEIDPKKSEGTTKVSWIWTMEGLTVEQNEEGRVDGQWLLYVVA